MSADTLRAQLGQVDADLTAARDAMNKAVTDGNMEAAQTTAARMITLEARRAALAEMVDTEEAKEKDRAAYLQSPERKQAMKRIAEIEREYKQEADAIEAALFQMYDRLQSVTSNHGELTQLIGRACIDLTPAQRSARIMNGDAMRLSRALNAVRGYCEIEKRAKA